MNKKENDFKPLKPTNVKKVLVNTDSNQYKWYKDKKISGLIILFLAIAMQVFAFLNLPVLTTLHSYTIGMIFGYFSPFFYLYIAYIGFTFAFDYKAPKLNWLNVNRYSYWFYVLSIMYIFVGTGYFQTISGWFKISSSAWEIMTKWFEHFTQSKKEWWLPYTTPVGVIGSFAYALTTTFISGIGSFIVSIVLIFFVVSKIITGSTLGFFRQKSRIKKLEELNKRKEETQVIKLVSEPIEKDVKHIDAPMKNVDVKLPENKGEQVIARKEITDEFNVIFDDEKTKTTKRKKQKEVNSAFSKKDESQKNDKQKNIIPDDDPFYDPFE